MRVRLKLRRKRNMAKVKKTTKKAVKEPKQAVQETNCIHQALIEDKGEVKCANCGKKIK